MLRKEKVLKLINEFSSQYTFDDISNGIKGITSYDIADQLHIARNNASTDLNELWEEGKIIKINGNRKFEFYSQKVFFEKTGIKLKPATVCSDLKELLGMHMTSHQAKDPFENLIGAHGSLKNAIVSAKASILYPGGTMHTLLLGESGVGKSLFAKTMYQFGINEKVFSKDSEFVVFNCADYANNSELLLSQLFGSLKGSYTGAEQTREGLIARADGGVLFLDEVHRLPPEGQEMLFYFIDTGRYRMLGESGIEHRANVSLIMATTEEPDNHLLTTFMRRIPMVIQIPNLKEKEIEEKKELILYLFHLEAIATGFPISLDREALLALILYNPPGNIGQLKNDIRLSVARSYLEEKQNSFDHLNIHVYSLSQLVRKGIEHLDSRTKENYNQQLLKDVYNISPYPYFYQSDDRKRSLNLSKSDVKTKFEEYVQEISESLEDQNHSAFILDEEIQEIMVFIHEWILYHMDLLLERSQSAAFAFYLKSVRDNNKNSFNFVSDEGSEEMMEISRNLVREIETKFHFQIPDHQIRMVASILSSFKDNKIQHTRVRMFVLAHGEALATNVAGVVNELLNGSFLTPFDMSLSKNVNELLDELTTTIMREPGDDDIILFVDMGSLVSVEKVLKEKVSQRIFVVPTINTIILLEAVRKITYLNYTVEAVLNDIIRMTKKLDHIIEHQIQTYIQQYTEKVIYTICYSGDGTARYLELYLKNIMEKNNIFNIDVLSLSNDSPKKIKKMIQETSQHKDVVCIIGNIDPELSEYPFISLEDILIRDGVTKVFKLMGNEQLLRDSKTIDSFKRDVFIDVSFESVQKYLLYLDAHKISPVIMSFIESIEHKGGFKCDNNILIRMVIHLCCMVERLMFGEYEASNIAVDQSSSLINTIQENIYILEKAFNISIGLGECEFIKEILLGDSKARE